jgi:starch synthase
VTPSLRVALLCASPGIPALAPGGASVHLRSLARGFLAAGADPRLFVRRMVRGGGTPDVQLPEELLVGQAPRGRLPGFLRKRRAWDEGVDAWAMERWLARSWSEWRPDLIYERWSLFAGLGAGLRRRFDVPWFLEVNAPLAWEACWFEGMEPRTSLLRKEAKTLCAADKVLVVSEELRDYVMRRGVPSARISVIPNGADRSVFCSLKPARLDDEKVVLGYEGTFKIWHGMLASMEALERLRTELKPRELELELWGDGPVRQEFLRRVCEQLPTLSVRYRGWGQPDRSAWTAAWIPQGSWPPPSDHIEQSFGESPPGRYFSSLKEAAARAAGVPCWYGDERGFVSSTTVPESWDEIGRRVLTLLS